MSVRKREWTTSLGVHREAWVVDYVDQKGDRKLKTFAKKKQADAFRSTASVEVRDGTHVADSDSITVAEAGAFWIASAERGDDEREPLERGTLLQYRQHLRLHIEPFIGATLLSKLTAPAIKTFASDLRKAGRSSTMVRYVVRSLGSILADAQENGLVTRNPVRERSKRNRRKGSEREDSRLEVGKDIPTPGEIKDIVNAAEGSWRPLLLTAIFTGLRASELRGLTWDDVDLKMGKLHVRQRADRFLKIGPPKTAAGTRTVPLPPIIVNTLREWRLRCPKKDGKLWLVLPNAEGNVQWHTNIVLRGLQPTLIKAGVSVPVLDANGKPALDAEGKPMVQAKYTGMHALRHFYASWCINRKQDGGLELPAKVVQHRIGHSSITVTLDTYGHLFPSGDDGVEMAAAELALLG